MPFCAAINCANRTPNYDGISFHAFPSEPSILRKWIVAMRRDHFKPSKHSKLCSNHFEESCFDPSYRRKIEFGLNSTKNRRRLRPEAVPTLFNIPGRSVPVKKRGAFEKRQRPSEILEMDPKRPRTEKSQKITKVLAPVPQAQDEDEVNFEPKAQSHSINVMCQRDERPVQVYNVATQYVAPRKGHIRHFKAQIKPHMCTKETQTDSLRTGKDIAVQCDLPRPLNGHDNVASTPDLNIDEDDEEEPDTDSDEEWLPSEDHITDFSCNSVEGEILRHDSDPVDERKFVVFESCLLALLHICQLCFCQCEVAIHKMLGSFVLIRATCRNGHSKDWCSQPLHKNMPLGNLLIAAASLFSGCQPAKAICFLNHCNIKTISARTYFKIQSAYLCPAVALVWKNEKTNMLATRKGLALSLGGDGRCCSPGHTAKYGSYSLMDLQDSKVIETQLVQSNEVKNSVGMELEGLKRCLSNLQQSGVTVKDLTTDRHTQVKKFMRVSQPDIVHQFDVWHVAKGLKKKLDKIGKKKGLEVVGKWAKSISNHVYWCAASSNGNGPEVLAKWMSVLNHICDIHVHEDDLFKKCLHAPLENREWLKKGSRAYKNIEDLLTKPLLLKDIQKLAPNQQTSALESFHNIICYFAPKHAHFFYEAMESRVILAALHFNENCNRIQATTALGEKRWGVTYSKANKGNPVPKEVKVPVTYAYVEKLMRAVYTRRQEFPSYCSARKSKVPRVIPSPVSSVYVKVNKDTVVNNHVTRFN